MTRSSSRPEGLASAGELLNEEFQTLLRDAASKREERALVMSIQEAEAAKQESDDLIALARRQAPGPRPAEF